MATNVARMMLPGTASEQQVEDQAYNLMYLPDQYLRATHERFRALGVAGFEPAPAFELAPEPVSESTSDPEPVSEPVVRPIVWRWLLSA